MPKYFRQDYPRIKSSSNDSVIIPAVFAISFESCAVVIFILSASSSSVGVRHSSELSLAKLSSSCFDSFLSVLGTLSSFRR